MAIRLMIRMNKLKKRIDQERKEKEEREAKEELERIKANSGEVRQQDEEEEERKEVVIEEEKEEMELCELKEEIEEGGADGNQNQLERGIGDSIFEGLNL